MDYTLIHIIWTILLFAIIIGIILWAWDSRTLARFDQAAQLPFADEEQANEEQKHTMESRNG